MATTYIATTNTSLVRETQTLCFARGASWTTGPVSEMRTVKTIDSSKWKWMVVKNTGISTTNKDPNLSDRTVSVATSISGVLPNLPSAAVDATITFIPVLTAGFIFNSSSLSESGSNYEPMSASLTASNVYNGVGVVTNNWLIRSGSSVLSGSSNTFTGVFSMGSYTASLSVTESTNNMTSVHSQIFVVQDDAVYNNLILF